jgi:hypothetical protein
MNFLSPRACYISRLSYSPWFYRPNHVSWRGTLPSMKFFIWQVHPAVTSAHVRPNTLLASLISSSFYVLSSDITSTISSTRFWVLLRAPLPYRSTCESFMFVLFRNINCEIHNCNRKIDHWHISLLHVSESLMFTLKTPSQWNTCPHRFRRFYDAIKSRNVCFGCRGFSVSLSWIARSAGRLS